MVLSLGDLSYNVTANTEGLNKSIDRLNEFSKLVDRTAKLQADGAKEVIRAYTAQEHAIKGALQQAMNLQGRLRSVSAPPEQIARVSNAFRGLTNNLTSGALSSLEFTRAQDRFKAVLAATTRDMRNFNSAQPDSSKNKFATYLRDIQSSATLAVGPLSGIGARIQAFAAITERSSWTLAAFATGVVGVVLGFGALSKAAIQAVLSYQQIQATLMAGTGSQVAAANEFQHIHDKALQLGIPLEALGYSYARLLAATQNTSLAGEKARKIFDNVSIAIRAMHMSSEQAGNVFLALEQMISKGSVRSEELSKQLGNVVPGAFKIFADSMGVSTSKLKEMLAAGQVGISTIYGFSEKLAATFGPSATASVDNLDAAINRLHTRMFDFLLAFDKAVGSSTIFKNIINALSNALAYLTNNINNVVGALGAIAGVITALAARSLVAMAIPAITTFTAAVAASGISLAAFGTLISGLLGPLALLGTVLVGAVGGFYLFKPGVDSAVQSASRLKDELDQLTNSAKLNIPVMGDMSEKMRTSVGQSIQELMNKIEDANKRMQDVSGQKGLNWFLSDFGRSKKIGEIQKEIDTYKAKIMDLNASFLDMQVAASEVKLPGDEKDIKNIQALANAYEKIREAQEEYLALQSNASNEELRRIKAVSAMAFSLSKEGVAQSTINTLTAQYAELLQKIDSGKALRDIDAETDKLFRQADAYRAASADMKTWASTDFPKHFKHLEELERRNKLLEDAGVPLEQINVQMERYTESLNAAERAEKAYNQSMQRIKEANAGIDKGFDELADSLTDIMMGTKSVSESFTDMINSILNDLTRMLIQESITNPFKELFKGLIGLPSTSSSGGTGGLFDIVGSLLGFAGGGSVPPNQPVIVGEKGPEILTLGSPGFITPNSQLNSYGGTNNSFQIGVTVNGPAGQDPKTATQAGQLIGLQLRAALTEWANDQKRVGGVFQNLR